MSTLPASNVSMARNIFWPVLCIVIGAMFLIEHDMRASLTFQSMINATSLNQLDAEGTMFDQNSGRQIGGVALGALGIFFIFQYRREGRAMSGPLAAWLLLFFSWALLSVAWAEDPGLTARRLVLFAFMGIGAWAIATRISPRELATLALAGPLVYLLIGIYAEYANGTLEFTAPGYRFAGTVHPNAQAINCAILFFSSFYFVRSTPRKRWPYACIMAFALVMLYLTKSRTALASTMVALAAFEAMLLRGPGRIAFFASGIAAVFAVLLISDALLPEVQDNLTLGRTDVSGTFGTLTGRWPLWVQLSGFASQHPVLGYGYGGFWNYDNSMAVIEEQGWPISHAHNAYLDTMLELGPVGCMALVAVLLLGVRKTYAARIASNDNGYEFLGLVLAFGILNGCLESQIVQRTFLTLLVMMSLAHLTTLAAAARIPSVPAPVPTTPLGARSLALSRSEGL